MVWNEGPITGSAALVLVDGVALLRPDEQVFEAMLRGWSNQGLARNLAPATVKAREYQVRAFQLHADSFPWEWMSHTADEWFADLRAVHHCARSTLRGYQVTVRGFCAFVTDPAYGWAQECVLRFGTHPVQIAWRRTAGPVQLRRRAGGVQTRPGQEGLAVGLSRRDDSEDRLLLRHATRRDPDARPVGLRSQPRGR